MLTKKKKNHWNQFVDNIDTMIQKQSITALGYLVNFK